MTQRRLSLALPAVLLGAVIATAGQATAGDVGGTRRMAAVEASVASGIDVLRKERGLARLRRHAGLTRAASAHSAEMLEQGYFSHSSADGVPAQSRIAAYYPRRAGDGPWRVGEVIYRGERAATGQPALTEWLASTIHRAQLFDPRFRDVGVSAIFSPEAAGAFGYRPVLVVTVVFGAR